MAVRSITAGLSQILRKSPSTIHNWHKGTSRTYSITFNTFSERDPAPLFFSKNVQDILKRVTGMDPKKVFKRRYDEKNLKAPKYEFLTDEELEEKMTAAKKKAETILQMPPVVKERQPIQKVLSQDPALAAYSPYKHIFTDITYGVSDRQRVIVVRDTDGTLREASWEERERMNQIYNPQPGRSFKAPKLFEEENLKGMLARGEYLFVLERACAQYEPDNPEFQRVTSSVYEAVDATRSFHVLHSTRHYGPMCFYLAWHRKIDALLVSLVQEERVCDASDIVQLYWMIHKDHQYSSVEADPAQHLQLVKRYLEEDSIHRAQLQLAVQAYEDLQQQRLHHQQQVTAAHGLSPSA